MNPTEFICSLMRQNTNALGFIPRPYLQTYFIPKYLYVIQQNRFRKPVGYILHGPVSKNGILTIHQACIDLDKRNRGFGLQAVQRVIKRAAHDRAGTIRLRCADNLEAIAFWRAIGFRATHITTGGLRRQRSLVHFSLPLSTH